MSPAPATNAPRPAAAGAAAQGKPDLIPPYASPIHALNPMTKLACLLALCVVGLFAPGPFAPALAFTVVTVGAIGSRSAGRVLRIGLFMGLAFGLLATGLRIVQSLGSAASAATTELILGAAGDTFMRVAVVAAAVALVSATTDRRDVALDLERRGMPHGSALTLVGLVAAGPAVAHRYRLIEDAQRARGLPLDAGWIARARGQVPLIFPTLVSSLHELGDRSLALESRAVSRPGRRTLLWAPAERRWELVVQVAAVVLSILITVGRVAGRLG